MVSQLLLLPALLTLELFHGEQVALQILDLLLLLVENVPELFGSVLHLFKHGSQLVE